MLESKIHYNQQVQNKEYEYELSLMGAAAHAYVSYIQSPEGKICFHLKSTAEIALFNINYHFEALSCWEKEASGLVFESYEEKDFSKNIKKKWEIYPDGFNYVENKKGLHLEREIAYFGEESMQAIYDPVAAVVQVLLCPLKDEETREVCVFGKQRVIKVLAKQKNDLVTFEHISGMSGVWPTLISTLQMQIKNEHIKEAKVASPLGIGSLVLKLKNQKNLLDHEVKTLLEKFNS